MTVVTEKRPPIELNLNHIISTVIIFANSLIVE